MKNFSWICEPRPISKCKVVLDVYFRPFSSILGVVFFQKMALCEYLILVIFGQFWLFRANFGPEISKEYLFQLFRCKKDNGITKSGLIWLFGKLGSPGAPKPTLGPKTPLNGPGRAKIGVNAPHAVQLTSFGPKKPDSNRTPQRSVPFTWNQPCAVVWIKGNTDNIECINPYQTGQTGRPRNCSWSRCPHKQLSYIIGVYAKGQNGLNWL